ncbi:hypothetical protein [Mangrovivirga cuniculi]|uniref:Uncharacterized protein n=1 Tax=Mangrovivirga cuniculi TaxID=2715131 RepID=A0A4D7JIY7_9BACT|nr:hypothetical protein [Mangrovivirga cuniculi]QCK13340.1 hypothetical protein DCC35_00535 [Mangrovivirga cuniculi]
MELSCGTLQTAGAIDIDLLDQGSKPWRALQAKIHQYIQEQEGQSSIGVDFNRRPNFDDIEDFLNGTKSLEEITNIIPCI